MDSTRGVNTDTLTQLNTHDLGEITKRKLSRRRNAQKSQLSPASTIPMDNFSMAHSNVLHPSVHLFVRLFDELVIKSLKEQTNRKRSLLRVCCLAHKHFTVKRPWSHIRQLLWAFQPLIYQSAQERH